jgi:tRNA nucleotidyltransferase (CCA-adding enzyme)
MVAQTPELARAYLVGGCVRDWLLGLPHKDYDLEVFGVTYERWAGGGGGGGRTDLVGRSFGVVKFTAPHGEVFDFTVPRRDSKVAPGHKGFQVTFDPALTPPEAAQRRDYTINSLMYDPRSGEVLDFFSGRADVRGRLLRHTSEAFAEDPLRVLRGMQLAARFNLTPAPETLALCRAIKGGYRELALERVREEWCKWAAQSTVPSAGLKFLLDTEWAGHYPEIQALRSAPQDPEWHPEGDVFVHTCHCCDALARLPAWQAADEETKIVLSFATLTHDFGKPQTTQHVLREGRCRIISPGHEEVGVALAESFLNRIQIPEAIRARVRPLVRQHMAHVMTVTDRSVRRLAKRLEPETIEHLCVLMAADASGRPPRPPQVPATVLELCAKAAELQVQRQPPPPILMGRHLLARGFQPGPRLGELLRAAYEAQLEGRIATLDQALAWVEARK